VYMDLACIWILHVNTSIGKTLYSHFMSISISVEGTLCWKSFDFGVGFSV